MTLSTGMCLLAMLAVGTSAAGIAQSPTTFHNMFEAGTNEKAFTGMDVPIRLGRNYVHELQVLKGLDEKLLANETIPWETLPSTYLKWKKFQMVSAIPSCAKMIVNCRPRY